MASLIILCTDFSDTPDKTFSYAFSMAKQYNATLHILHVVDTRIDGEPEHATLTDFDKEMIESTEKVLEKKLS